MNRRTFLFFLIGGLLLRETAFSLTEVLTPEEERAINELMLFIIGIEDRRIDLISRIKSERSRIDAGFYKRFLGLMAQYYKKGISFDFKAFLSDLEAKKVKGPPIMQSMAESIKADAIKVFYTAKEGWAIAGYEGPPLKGYQDYNVCR